MRKVMLYGELAKRFGREHHLSVRTASEAVQALCVNYPEFKSYLKYAHKDGIGFKVFVGNAHLRRAEDAALPSSDTDTIRIAPALLGSGAITRIIVGAVLIVGGIVIGVGASAIGGGVPGSMMVSMGISLILGGVFELLSSPPSTPGGGDSGENGQSFVFGGPENVTRQGGGIPVGYGRMMVGSTVVSAGIEDQDQ